MNLSQRLLCSTILIACVTSAQAAPNFGAKASGSELSSPGIVQDGGPGSSSASVSETNFNASAAFVATSTFLPELKAFSQNSTASNSDDLTQSTAEAYQAYTSSASQTVQLNVVLHGVVTDNTTDRSFVLADVFVFAGSSFQLSESPICPDGRLGQFTFDGVYFCGNRVGRANLFIPVGDVTRTDLLSFPVGVGENFGVYAVLRANSSGGSADATQTLSLSFDDDSSISAVEPPVSATAADHFHCYQAEGEKLDRMVSLRDQFENEQDVRIKEPKLFCNPVAKTTADGETTPVGDSTAHQTGYSIAATGKLEGRVSISNQFGDEQVLRVKRAKLLFVPSEKDGVPSDLNIDHYKCYAAKGKKIRTTVTLEDQFGVLTDVKVKQPRLLCNPADKNGEGILNESSPLACYKISKGDDDDSSDDGERFVGVFNQLDAQTLEVGKSRLLCVPSETLSADLHGDDDENSDD